jgi:hypothetical protein
MAADRRFDVANDFPRLRRRCRQEVAGFNSGLARRVAAR